MYRQKVELHLHLDGSIRPETAQELLNKNKSKKYSLNEVKKLLAVTENDSTLTDYLKKFDLPIELLQSEDSLERVSYELVQDLAEENTIYAEIRVAPVQHTNGGLSPIKVTESILRGIKRGTREYDIEIGLLLCAMRNRPPSESFFLIDIADKLRDKGVVGLDLAGDEAGFPALPFKELFEKAMNMNIPFTIHAGEARGPESIREAIDIGASRVGHGIRAYESEDVMNLILERGICLECCPVSNRDTNAIKDFSNYPLINYMNRGIAVTLSSDNRTVSNTNFDNEVEFLRDYTPLSEDEIKQLNINAVRHSFISNEIKKELLKKLDKEI